MASYFLSMDPTLLSDFAIHILMSLWLNLFPAFCLSTKAFPASTSHSLSLIHLVNIIHQHFDDSTIIVSETWLYPCARRRAKTYTPTITCLKSWMSSVAVCMCACCLVYYHACTLNTDPLWSLFHSHLSLCLFKSADASAVCNNERETRRRWPEHHRNTHKVEKNILTLKRD